jgi:uncharacterized BrkB/YihY/UPF0761 family membrane protein
LIWVRVAAATLLTGLLSPFLFGLFLTCFVVQNSQAIQELDPLKILSFGAIVGGFGSLIALPCAILQGLLVEWPLMVLQKRRMLKFRLHVAIGTCTAFFIMMLVTEVFGVLPHPRETVADFADGLPFSLLAAFCGGLCSAWFWSKLVAHHVQASK